MTKKERIQKEQEEIAAQNAQWEKEKYKNIFEFVKRVSQHKFVHKVIVRDETITVVPKYVFDYENVAKKAVENWQFHSDNNIIVKITDRQSFSTTWEVDHYIKEVEEYFAEIERVENIRRIGLAKLNDEEKRALNLM